MKKKTYVQLLNHFDDHCSEALMLSRKRPFFIRDATALVEKTRAALCAAQELENLAKGVPAPPPGL